MKKALIISYYWPPTGGSGVQRWVKFSKYLPELGWQPIIYTPENPEMTAIDTTLASEIPDCVEVIRTHITEPYGLVHKFSGKKSSQGGEVNPVNSQKKTLKQRLMMFIRGNFFIPDPRCFWIRPSVKYLKKYLKDHPVDIIISTGPPHSMHLIAKKVSQATNIPWIADFRDPWTEIFYFKHFPMMNIVRKKHKKLEKSVLDTASTIVAVSPAVQKDFQKMTSTTVELVTNGFDEDDFKRERQEDGYFNISHTGLFSKDGNPDVLWNVLSELCKEDPEFKKMMRLRFCGKTDNEILACIKEAGLDDNLINLGYQDHNTAVQEQINASMLILPIRKEPESKSILPGKLFEYLASRRPLLGIDDAEGATAKVMRDTKAGLTVNWDDADSMKSFILDCWHDFRSNQNDQPIKDDKKSTTRQSDDESDIIQYSRRSTAEKMASIMNKLTNS